MLFTRYIWLAGAPLKSIWLSFFLSVIYEPNIPNFWSHNWITASKFILAIVFMFAVNVIPDRMDLNIVINVIHTYEYCFVLNIKRDTLVINVIHTYEYCFVLNIKRNTRSLELRTPVLSSLELFSWKVSGFTSNGGFGLLSHLIIVTPWYWFIFLGFPCCLMGLVGFWFPGFVCSFQTLN